MLQLWLLLKWMDLWDWVPQSWKPKPPAGWAPVDQPASGEEMPTALNTLHVEEFATASGKIVRRLEGRRIKFVAMHCPQCHERLNVPIESFTVRREPPLLVSDRSLVCGYDDYRHKAGCGATFPIRLGDDTAGAA